MAPCYEQRDGPACSSIRDQLMSISSETFRPDQYQGFEFMQSEACVSDPQDQCLLDSVTLQPLANATCKQGLVSPHYIKVVDAGDIKSAFSYARQTKAKLSIKNSGHDYIMRSTRRGSLGLWTRGLKKMEYEPSFTASNCTDGSAPVNAITFGAGVNTDEALAFAHEHGVVINVASGETIGISGGFLLYGGHGTMSGKMGLAVDRVLQFTIVTPDGEVRTANRCTNPDLFWALRGGGGAFGVILDSTQLVDPETTVTSAILALNNPDINQKREFTSILVNNMVDWALNGWGGASGTSYMALINSNLNVSQAETVLAPAIDYVKDLGGIVLLQSYGTYFDYYTDFKSGSFAPNATISTAVIPTSRILPEAVFINGTTRNRLVEALLETEAAGLQTAIMATTPLLYGRQHPIRNTSIHPVWYDSVAIVASTGQWTATSPMSQRRNVVALVQNATKTFEQIAPDGCTYANEADPWQENWAVEAWGENYERLLEVKQSVDPDGLLSCWHCVGWNKSQPDYHCISGLGR